MEITPLWLSKCMEGLDDAYKDIVSDSRKYGYPATTASKTLEAVAEILKSLKIVKEENVELTIIRQLYPHNSGLVYKYWKSPQDKGCKVG